MGSPVIKSFLWEALFSDALGLFFHQLIVLEQNCVDSFLMQFIIFASLPSRLVVRKVSCSWLLCVVLCTQCTASSGTFSKLVRRFEWSNAQRHPQLRNNPWSMSISSAKCKFWVLTLKHVAVRSWAHPYCAPFSSSRNREMYKTHPRSWLISVVIALLYKGFPCQQELEISSENKCWALALVIQQYQRRQPAQIHVHWSSSKPSSDSCIIFFQVRGNQRFRVYVPCCTLVLVFSCIECHGKLVIGLHTVWYFFPLSTASPESIYYIILNWQNNWLSKTIFRLFQLALLSWGALSGSAKQYRANFPTYCIVHQPKVR